MSDIIDNSTAQYKHGWDDMSGDLAECLPWPIRRHRVSLMAQDDTNATDHLRSASEPSKMIA